MGIYDYNVVNKKGEEISLRNYKDKVLMIVNTATECGFTPQYKDLEEIYKKFHDKGFELIDIPCNQFAGQAPGTDDEIQEFCMLKFGTSYEQMKKSDVNGENQLPLYKYLKTQQGFKGFTGPKAEAMNDLLKSIDKDFENNPEIKWNFTKFIVDREGNVVKRFEPTEDMKVVEKYVETLL